jgi:hypothetical protein
MWQSEPDGVGHAPALEVVHDLVAAPGAVDKHQHLAPTGPTFEMGAAVGIPDHHSMIGGRVDSALPGRGSTASLGALLAIASFEAPVRYRPPLELWASGESSDVTRVPVSISTCSGTWPLWSSARYEKGAESEDFAHNPALARRHTPRLNAFLARLRERTLQMGDLGWIDRDITYRDLFFEVDDHGVLLDAENPLERVSEAKRRYGAPPR